MSLLPSVLSVLRRVPLATVSSHRASIIGHPQVFYSALTRTTWRSSRVLQMEAVQAEKRPIAETDDAVEKEENGVDASSSSAAAAAASAANKKQRTDEDDGKQEGHSLDSFRICINNLPKFCNAKDINSFLDKLGCAAGGRVKKAPQWNYAFANYETEEARDKALELVNGAVFKKFTLDAVVVSGTNVRHVPKTRQTQVNLGIPMSENLNDRVTPLWRLTYEKQLEKKHADMLAVLVSHGKQLAKNGVDYIPRKEPMVPLPPVVPSPRTVGYRNKCEFTIGKDYDGKPTIGFMLGGFQQGVTLGEPSECIHVSDGAKALVTALNKYIRQEGAQSTYDQISHKGFWRLLSVRTNEKNEVLAVIQAHANEPRELLDAEQVKLVAFLKDNNVKIDKLFWQEESRLSNAMTNSPLKQLIGTEPTFVEDMLGLSFVISPLSFFQVNTVAAAELYGIVGSECTLSHETTLLDLCCGTGTIGLTLAKKVKHVIGVELLPEAIEDAKRNAVHNGISNVTYYASRVEDVMDKIVRNLTGHVVAILDPPRSGVLGDVIKAIRNCPSIKEVIYVSCDAKRVDDNFVCLTKPASGKYTGAPFKATNGFAVDLFPHTEHCELVVRFARG